MAAALADQRRLGSESTGDYRDNTVRQTHDATHLSCKWFIESQSIMMMMMMVAIFVRSLESVVPLLLLLPQPGNSSGS